MLRSLVTLDLAARDVDELGPLLGRLVDPAERLERVAVLGLELEDLQVVLGRGVDVARAFFGHPRDPLEQRRPCRRRGRRCCKPHLQDLDQPRVVLGVLVEPLERRRAPPRRRDRSLSSLRLIRIDCARVAGALGGELRGAAQRLGAALRIALGLGAALPRLDQRRPVVALLAQVLEDLAPHAAAASRPRSPSGTTRSRRRCWPRKLSWTLPRRA